MKKKKNHIFEEGSREHVISWIGELQPDGSTKGKEVCSELDCEINHSED